MKAMMRYDKLKYFGDLKDYCPVTLYNSNILRRGLFGAKWLDRNYYMDDIKSLNLFIENPTKFLPTDVPFKPPPPRICVTGSPSCAQEEVSIVVLPFTVISTISLRIPHRKFKFRPCVPSLYKDFDQ